VALLAAPSFAAGDAMARVLVSGTVTDSKQLAKAMAALGPGDVLIVTKLDRLARSTRDLLNSLAAIGKAEATFRSLGDAWADTTTPHGRLMLTVLGGLAEFERHLILARTSEGRVRAKARGIKFGRKSTLTAHQQQEALARRARWRGTKIELREPVKIGLQQKRKFREVSEHQKIGQRPLRSCRARCCGLSLPPVATRLIDSGPKPRAKSRTAAGTLTDSSPMRYAATDCLARNGGWDFGQLQRRRFFSLVGGGAQRGRSGRAQTPKADFAR
jgi:DNA invertase Pin-like site-specific DNA recombinase